MVRIPERNRWRSIWISDLHLGSKHAQVDALLEFLKRTEAEHLYLVGDFIDGWELRRGWTWGDSANALIQKVLKKSRKGTRVTYGMARDRVMAGPQCRRHRQMNMQFRLSTWRATEPPASFRP